MPDHSSVDNVVIPVSNRKIPIRISGEGQPILLLHGYPLDSRLWDKLVPLLSMDHLCISPDLRGFGQSDEESKSFSIADLADDCEKILGELQIRRPVVVCGLSMGGYVAMQFAERHATRLASVILTNTRANADDEAGAAARRTVAGVALTEGVAAVVLPMLAKMMSPQTMSHQIRVVELVRSMMLETPASTIAWAQLAMSVREDFRFRMRSWKIPVVCVAGTEDTIAPPEIMEQMARLAPKSEMHIVSNSAHLTPLECPEEFAQIVRKTTSVL